MPQSVTYELVFDDNTSKEVKRTLEIRDEVLKNSTMLRLLILNEHNDRNPKNKCKDVKNIRLD